MLPLKNDIRTDTFPTFIVALIAANVFVFLWQLSVGPQQSIEFFGAVPRAIVQGGPMRGCRFGSLCAPRCSCTVGFFIWPATCFSSGYLADR